MKVIAAMSGGVDSAVAAARAVDAGHSVTGVHLALAGASQAGLPRASSCCTPDDARDAARAADVVGIPFHVWDLTERFRAAVVEDFVAQYAAGLTPNPCLRCNERIKFAALLDRAIALGFDAVVTGHYARLDRASRLRRAADPPKDQSYVLAGLTPRQLERSVFPLGGSTKADVRAEAGRRGLAVADKPDSHDVCFIADGDIRRFLAGRLGSEPGDIVDATTGSVIGRHHGAYAYTIGQRRGLDLRVAAPDRRPRYVLAVDPAANTVRVGPVEALDITTIEASHPIWPSSGPPNGPEFECQVQFRAHGEPLPAVVHRRSDERLTVRLAAPARGVAPGQAIVCYQVDAGGDLVLGSGTITRAAAMASTRAT